MDMPSSKVVQQEKLFLIKLSVSSDFIQSKILAQWRMRQNDEATRLNGILASRKIREKQIERRWRTAKRFLNSKKGAFSNEWVFRFLFFNFFFLLLSNPFHCYFTCSCDYKSIFMGDSWPHYRCNIATASCSFVETLDLSITHY